MRFNLTLTAFAALALAIPAAAQSTLPAAMAKHWKTSGEFTLAVANAMPDDGYSFRPNDEEMTFGQLMGHIAGVNNNACGNASGLEKVAIPPALLAWSKDPLKVAVKKADVIPFMKDTFAFCDKAVAAMTAEKWDKITGPPARNLTGLEWLWGYFTHTAHHRGQAEVYLRVKGIKPPAYAF